MASMEEDTADNNPSNDTNEMEDDAGEGPDVEMEDDDEDYSSSHDEDESFSEDYDDDDEDSSLGSDVDEEARRLWNALQSTQPTLAPPAKSPEQVMQEYLNAVHESKTTALKIDDGMVQYVARLPPSLPRVEGVNKLCRDLTIAIRSCKDIRHVILGTSLLQLFDAEQQMALYQLLIVKHASTITYWKLGSDDSTELCGIPTEALLQQMVAAEWPGLTEFQVRGLQLSSQTEVDLCVQLLRQTAPTMKLFNLLGLVLSPQLLATDGLFDSLWRTVEPITQLDEVQLHRTHVPGQDETRLPALTSHAALEHLLQVKPKWWRMALDGMGLDDGHLQIIGHALKTIPDCKMNDLLSICNNPKATPKGLSQLYNVCLNKQRMGLVHSDDPSWVATFDLVRPLNNLHRRLEYKDVTGLFTSPTKWMDWFQVLSNLPWMDEARKLNYIWFTLLEQPEMIATAIEYCSRQHGNSNNATTTG